MAKSYGNKGTKNMGYGKSFNKKASAGAKKASDGRVTTKKAAIDPNPKGRTVPMAGNKL